MPISPQEKQIIDWGLQNGKTREETEQAIIRYRTTGSPANPNTPPVEETVEPTINESQSEGFLKGAGREIMSTYDEARQRLIDDLRSTSSQVQEAKTGPERAIAVSRSGLRPIGTVLKTAFEAPFTGLTEGLASTQSVQDFSNRPDVAQAVEGITLAVAETLAPVMVKLQQFGDTYPELARDLQDVGEIVLTLVGEKPLQKALEKSIEGVQVGTRGTSSSLSEVADGIQSGVKGTLDDTLLSAQNLRKRVQQNVASKNVNPQLIASAERIEQPLNRYNEYFDQAQRSLNDVKVDKPVQEIGSKVGEEFNKVVGMRRAVGKQISDELAEVGGIRLEVVDPLDNFTKNLVESGVRYDGTRKQIIPIEGQTKFTAQDTRILADYAEEVTKLGFNPTVKEVDAFLSRISSELDIYKSTNNIIGTTNAERIIKNSMSDIRGQLNPDVSGISELQGLYQARQTYADLSDFIHEGSRFLGKVTQSGDFAKDTSLVKSSVTSILNNGKKDFLLELEGLTGYSALDDAVLALQAEADAGIVQSRSLLDLLADGSIPASGIGIVDRILGFVTDKGKEVIVGPPEEQTRALLESLPR